jgi:hypothetical protein
MYYLKEEIERLKNLSGMHELNARGKAKLKEFEQLLIIVQNQGQTLPIDSVVGQSEQLKPVQECYKSGEPCKYDCSGLCKESC